MTRHGLSVRADRRLRLALGFAGAALLAILLLGAYPLLFFFTRPEIDPGAILGDAYLRGVVGFTLMQAALSALLSVAGALPLALALHRARFPGRALVLRLLLLPQALPVLVGALAIVAVWGRAGIVSDGLAALGLPRLDIYGLTGILLAHVFFNLPLAARMMIAALDAVPAERWKLAGQLGLGARATMRLVEWPAIRRVLPGAASLAFMLCVTSFTLVLVLGGGPRATTLEVAIYQALRYDFDPGRAILLSLGQIALTAALLFLAVRLGSPADAAGAGFTLGGRPRRFDRRSGRARGVTLACLVLGLAFVLSPFLAILREGLSADLPALLARPAVRRAALTSLVVGLSAATLSLALSLAILLGQNAGRGPARLRALEVSASLALVVPPIVVGAGWFLAVRGVMDVSRAAPFLLVATNAAMAVPFLVRIVGPALAAGNARHRRLADSLALTGRARFRLVDWPAMRAPLGLGFAFALAISLGDLGAVALFGNPDLVTLPYLLYGYMGSYRMNDAAGLALLLGALCLGLISAAEWGLARTKARA